ncbi:hypothetical protein PZ61_0235685 [Streptomyces sp. MNU77]|uniref:ABC transporter substrate-binding protein n=1 Tax=Streptomyces sp. MNU77 TaxID=1573406 RepID=UPI0005DAEF5D|nr:ABC transporter substrate-binding protein [Streptomyces sp. MNU77]OLO25781.1 hypothetical protein PZ61_0235685 [Streptomyces sp. MNU77]
MYGISGRAARTVVALLCAGAVAGCTSDASGEDRTAAASGPAPTGPPVRIVSVQDALTAEQYEAGIDAAVAAVNREGGIAGRPLHIEHCSNEDNADVAAACARSAANDKSVVAVVGSANNFGSATAPVYEQAGLVSLQHPYTQADYTSPSMYNISGGAMVTAYAGAALMTERLEAEKTALAYLDVPAGRAMGPQLRGFYGPRDLTAPAGVAVSKSAADLSPQVAKVLDGDPDAVQLALTTDLASRFIQSVRQQGSQVPIVVPSMVYSAETVREQLGDATDELYFAGELCHGAPGYDKFTADVEADKGEYSTDSALTGWTAVQVFAQIAGKLDRIERGSFTAAIKKTSAIDGLGVIPDLDFTKSSSALDGQYPRLFNTSGCAFEYTDGGIEQYGDPLDDLFRP